MRFCSVPKRSKSSNVFKRPKASLIVLRTNNARGWFRALQGALGRLSTLDDLERITKGR